MAERYLTEDPRRSREERPSRRNRERGENIYGEHGYAYGPGYDMELLRPLYAPRTGEDRGFVDRASDAVRSWFGDEEAERRRRMDERFEDRDRAHSPDRFGDTRARDVMTHDVATVYPWDTVERAARLMGDCRCGSLPVISESGRLVGIITDRDIAVRVAGRGIDPRRARVDEYMSSDVFACHEQDLIEGCMRQMSRHQVRRLPIVDDRDRVIGIVSQGDLARHAGTHPGWGERRAMADVLCAVSEPTNKPRR